MTYSREKQVAIEAVSQAAKLCTAVQADMVNVDSLEKQDRSPVTIADFGAQAVVCRHITANFSQDPIVGEEDSADLQKPENSTKLSQVTHYVQQLQPEATPEVVCEWIDAGNASVAKRFWTLDPIDGTKGFLRNEQYAIALALIEDGQVKVATLACPGLSLDSQNPDSKTGVIFAAVRGEGVAVASIDSDRFTPIRVAAESDKERLRFVESVEAAHGDHGGSARGTRSPRLAAGGGGRRELLLQARFRPHLRLTG